MTAQKHFIKKIEDFVCDNCGTKVQGNGYTNHCTNCLYSKHVDLEVPGDRLSDCLGLMKPITLEIKNGKYLITHQCLKCDLKKNNYSATGDNFEVLLKISAKN